MQKTRKAMLKITCFRNTAHKATEKKKPSMSITRATDNPYAWPIALAVRKVKTRTRHMRRSRRFINLYERKGRGE